MNDYKERLATAGQSGTSARDGLSGKLFPSVYLPKALYEALPAAYVSVGLLFVAGAIYLGFGYGFAVGYMAVGLTCILGGLTVSSIRRAERSK